MRFFSSNDQVHFPVFGIDESDGGGGGGGIGGKSTGSTPFVLADGRGGL